MKCIHVVNYVSVPDLSVLGGSGSGSYIRSDPGGKIYSDPVAKFGGIWIRFAKFGGIWIPNWIQIYFHPDPTFYMNRIRIHPNHSDPDPEH